MGERTETTWANRKEQWADTELATCTKGEPYYLPDGTQICGAKTRSGRPCFAIPISTANRCRMHNGGARFGPMAPTAKNMRWSKYLPPRMLEKYEEALRDDELLNLRDEIAVIDARIEDLMKRVDTGIAGAWLGVLKSNYEALDIAISTGDAASTIEALEVLGRSINKRLSDFQTWEEVMRLMEQRRRFVESERKRLVEMQQMISSERAYGMVMYLLAIIKEHVTDGKVLAAIGRDVRALIAQGDS